MKDLEKVQKTLSVVFDYLNRNIDTGVSKQLLTEVGDAHRIVENLAINGISNAERTLAIKFADTLLNDFEISELENKTLCWKLCGVPHKYTTSEAYDRYIDEILGNDC